MEGQPPPGNADGMSGVQFIAHTYTKFETFGEAVPLIAVTQGTDDVNDLVCGLERKGGQHGIQFRIASFAFRTFKVIEPSVCDM